MTKEIIAELFATFCLVLFGCGAIVVSQEMANSINHLGIALAFGGIVTVMIWTFGKISGAQMNPAVSISLAILKEISWKKALLFILVQCIGALLASFVLQISFPTNEFLGASLPSGSAMQSFGLEIFLTFVLMLVICFAALGNSEQQKFAPLAIGGTVFLEALVFGPITGASMNPARSLGPAVVSGHTEHLWLYLIGTTLGAVLAVFIWKIFKTSEE